MYKDFGLPDVKSDDDGQGQDDQRHYPGNIILIELEKYLFYVVQEHHLNLQSPVLHQDGLLLIFPKYKCTGH